MATATAGAAYVRALRLTTAGGAVTGLTAVIATPVDVDGVMQQDLEREVDAWTDTDATKQAKFQAVVDYILTL